MSDAWQLVVAYGRASAALSDPFARPGAVFAALGLDAGQWPVLEARARHAMSEGVAKGDRSLLYAFMEAFRSERLSRTAPPCTSAPSRGIASSSDVDGTAIVAAVPSPALPFAGTAQPPPMDPPCERDVDDALNGTAETDPARMLDVTLPFIEK